MSGEGAPASDGGLPSGHHDERNFLRREVMMALNRNTYPFRTGAATAAARRQGRRGGGKGGGKGGARAGGETGSDAATPAEVAAGLSRRRRRSLRRRRLSRRRRRLQRRLTCPSPRPSTRRRRARRAAAAAPAAAPRLGLDARAARERRTIDFSGKVYIAPLTTVGNLPFRRVLKKFGADITCGEMALAPNLLKGTASEWSLLRRHADEDVFGAQIAGAHADQMARVAELLEAECELDFVDVNLGCPLDAICAKGCGAALMQRRGKLEQIARGMIGVLSCPLTIKMRTGWSDGSLLAHKLVPAIQRWYNGAPPPDAPKHAAAAWSRCRAARSARSSCTAHARSGTPKAPTGNTCAASRLRRTRSCTSVATGNGDILSSADWEAHRAAGEVAPCCKLGARAHRRGSRPR